MPDFRPNRLKVLSSQWALLPARRQRKIKQLPTIRLGSKNQSNIGTIKALLARAFLHKSLHMCKNSETKLNNFKSLDVKAQDLKS